MVIWIPISSKNSSSGKDLMTIYWAKEGVGELKKKREKEKGRERMRESESETETEWAWDGSSITTRQTPHATCT